MADIMLDIFNDDGFSTTNLTDAINDITYVPGRVGEMGLFLAESVDTTTIAVEKKGDTIIVVPPTPRGGPGTTVGKAKRTLLPLSIPHHEINDAIYAEEVQNIRQFGRARQLETVATKVAQRSRMHTASFGVTEEYARLGAVQGVVTYADGTSLDLFSTFGVTQEAELDFDLDNATPSEGVLRRFCAAVCRKVTELLGGVPFNGVRVLCGDNFFDDLLSHKEVRETYKGWSQAQILRESYLGKNRSTYGVFEFGGIVFENYRGSPGLGVEIHTDKCTIFPEGVPGLFRTVYAPADYEETVNTMGKRLTARQYAMANGKGRHFDVQMNAIQYCTRPKVLLKGKRT